MWWPLLHTATYYNTLQHSATPCSIRQHTATPCMGCWIICTCVCVFVCVCVCMCGVAAKSRKAETQKCRNAEKQNSRFAKESCESIEPAFRGDPTRMQPHTHTFREKQKAIDRSIGVSLWQIRPIVALCCSMLQ